MTYDKNNIFAKIMRGEMPCKKIYEDAHAFAFEDIAPVAPVHVLVLPKGEYVSFNDFAAKAPKDLVHGFFAAVQKIAAQLKLEANGYRIITNTGNDASQTVHHFHVHIIGGRKLGALVP